MDSESFVASRVEPSINTNPETVKPHIERFKFTGSGGEYFGIWIVNILLTILTLGIYSAWAKVRNKQYFYGNTVIDNHSFEYTAKPLQILKGRIVAVLLFILYAVAESFIPLLAAILLLCLFLASPWIIMKSLAFNAFHSQYRSIKFNFHQNFWDAAKTFILMPILAFIPAIGLMVLFFFMAPVSNDGATSPNGILVMALMPLLSLLAIYLVYPFVLYIANRYTISNHAFGGKDFRFRVTNPMPYFKIFLITIFVGIGAFFIAAIIVGAFIALSGDATNISSDLNNLDTNTIAMAVLAYAFFGSIYAFVYAFYKAKMYNLVYQNTALAKHKLRAKMNAIELSGLYITNTLGIVFTLGLFIPWAKVRMARFRADNTALQVHGDLSNFIATQSEYENALGEEIGEVFDLDIGI